MDAVVLRDKLWLVVIESKRYGFSVRQAIVQTLTDMMALPAVAKPIGFGLVTTGEDFLFIKLDRVSRQYALSDKFTLSTIQDNQLTPNFGGTEPGSREMSRLDREKVVGD